MTKNIFSDGVLVYDRYYCSRPNTPLLIIKRALLAAVFCACSMLFILTEFRFPVSLPTMGAVCGVSCLVFSALFVFVKKRFAIPAILLISAAAVWWNFEALAKKLTYFADACMLLVEGRFLYPRRFLFHRGEVLDAANPAYVEGVALGTILMCLLYSLIISACFSGRLVPVPAALLFTALCVPTLISERLEFSLWLIPALAALAAAFAIRKNYSGGLAVKHSGSSDYRRRIRCEERSFMKRVSGAPYFKRLQMTCNYRNKYFSTGLYCAALVSVCLAAGALAIPEGGSIDYTSVYEFITSLASDNSAGQSPFEEGAASEYFTQAGAEEKDSLNIISPGRGEREIIRVTYTGSRPVYLRGDIGIDFNGASWSTAVSSEPEQWSSSGLKENYRPCEGRVISALLSATGYGSSEPLITSSDVNIEYLCDTNVVFLPPYTAEYSFYNSDSFDVYSDYAVRVRDEAGGTVNSVQCTALVPVYTSNERYDGTPEAVAELDSAFESVMCLPDDIYSSVVPEMRAEHILSDYEDYVDQTYSSVPSDFSADLEEYIQRTIEYILDNIEQEYDFGYISEAEYRYRTADAVADYLRTHYTYSLDGSNNSRNPVMQFLNDTKRGHCSLYASAMTLILRQRGIPARYCTGFYVEGENGRNSVVLREKNLHAWVEVYLGQYGWATFDPTSSSAYPDRAPADEIDAPPELTGEPPAASWESTQAAASEEYFTYEPVLSQDTATTESATTEETAEVLPPAPTMLDSLRPFIPAALAALAAIAVLAGVLVWLSALKKSAYRTLENLKAGGSEASRTVYRLILALLEHSGITPRNGELPDDYFRRADETLGTQLSGCAETFAELEFGGHELSDEAALQLDSQLERLVDVLRPFRFPGKVGILRLIGEFTKFY